MFWKRREESLSRLGLGAFAPPSHAQPSFNERPDQPWPHCALMVGAVAFARAAPIMGCVAGFFGRQRAQAQRGPESLLDGVDDPARLFAVDNLQGQAADGEYWIGPKRSVEFS